MALSQRQVVWYARGLVVVISSVALSSGAVQAQTVDTPTRSSAPQAYVFQPEPVSPSGRASVVLVPRFSESELHGLLHHQESSQLSRPAFQPSRRSSQGGGSHKVLAGVAGGVLGGLVGVAVGSAMARNSHSSDREMAAGMIGFPVGAAIGAVVFVKLAR
jgi:hypothetical protein